MATFFGITWQMRKFVPGPEGTWLAFGIIVVTAILVAISVLHAPWNYLVTVSAAVAGLLGIVYNPRAPSKFLLWVSGTEVQALVDASPDGDERHSAGYQSQTILGCVVLVTAIIAVFSMRIAAQMLLPTWTWFLMPVTWGVAILSFDRAMVKQIRPADPSAGESWWRFVPAVIFRLGLAGMVSLVVSVPIELFVARSEINAELNKRMILDLQDKRNLVVATFKPTFQRIDEEEKALRDQGTLLKTNADGANKRHLDELQRFENFKSQHPAAETGPNAVTGESRIEWKRRLHTAEQLAADTAKTEADTYRQFQGHFDADISKLESQRTAAKAEEAKAINALASKASDSNAFFERYEVYQSLNRPGVWALKLGLRIFFVFVELLPVCVKLLSVFFGKSPYEKALKNFEEREEARLDAKLEPDRQGKHKRKLAELERDHGYQEGVVRFGQIRDEQATENKNKIDLLNQKGINDREREKTIAAENLREDLTQLQQLNFANDSISAFEKVTKIEEAANRESQLIRVDSEKAIRQLEEAHKATYEAAMPKKPVDPRDLPEIYYRERLHIELTTRRMEDMDSMLTRRDSSIKQINDLAEEQKKKITDA